MANHFMRALFILGFAATVTSFTEGCATSSSGPVQEVEPGTYTIGVSRGSGVLSGNDALSAAVDKAGEFCHSKGQKFLLKTAVGSSIVFRCVSGDPKPQ
jgi:hypothetical protein